MLHIKQIKNILGHIFISGIIYLLIFITSKNILASYLAAIFFYIGRERRDYEIKENIPIRDYYKGWNIFKWDLLDLFPSIIFWGIISLLIKYFNLEIF